MFLQNGTYRLLTILAISAVCRGVPTLNDHTSSSDIAGKTDLPYSNVPPALDLRSPAVPNLGPIQQVYGQGWHIKYRQAFSMIIPVEVAASVLEAFLSQTLEVCAYAQAHGKASPGNKFTLKQGSVFLAFKIADETLGMSWEAVERLVDALLDNVRMGFSAQFVSEWFHPESGMLVYVSLAMLQRFGPGPVVGEGGWNG